MAFDFGVVTSHWSFIAQGCWITLVVSVMSILIAFVIGTGVAIARVYAGERISHLLGFFYVDMMRSVPLLVILVWVYFALPVIVGVNVDPMTCAIVVLGLHLGAEVCEVVRGGLLSIRQGQMKASLALGMSWAQAIRAVILPQAFIRSLPPLASIIIVGFKDSALASVIAVPELLRQSQVLAGQTFQPFEIYTAALVLYGGFLYPVALALAVIYDRYCSRMAA